MGGVMHFGYILCSCLLSQLQYHMRRLVQFSFQCTVAQNILELIWVQDTYYQSFAQSADVYHRKQQHGLSH